MRYYLNQFFVYSVIGFLMESVVYMVMGSRGGSGILYGPWTPVYGFGVIIILFVTKTVFHNFKGNRLLKLLAVFLIVTVLLTLIEYLGGVFIETLFHTTFWDYSKHKYHLGKYVALDMSLLWGLMSIFFIYCIHPWMDQLIRKIPRFITVLLVLGFLIDCVVTFILLS